VTEVASHEDGERPTTGGVQGCFTWAEVMAKDGMSETGQVLTDASKIDAEEGIISSSHLVCRFRQYYPGEYVNLAYPTLDNVIPYSQFLMLMRGIPSLEARRRAGSVIEQNTSRTLFEGDKKAVKNSEKQLYKWIAEGWPEQA